MIGIRKRTKRNGQINSRDITSSKGLVGVDHIEVDRDREIGSNGVDLAKDVVIRDERGERLLVLAECFRSDISTALANGAPRFNAV